MNWYGIRLFIKNIINQNNMRGRYAIYNHRNNCWLNWSNIWIEDSDTTKSGQNIKTYDTLGEAEFEITSGYIYKNNPNDFYTIRKIYY